MENCLRGIEHVAVYLDNINVTGKNLEHFENLKLVLQRLQDSALRLNKCKCNLKKKI